MQINTTSSSPAVVLTGLAKAQEEAKEIRNGTTEEGAARPVATKMAEQARGLGTAVDIRA